MTSVPLCLVIFLFVLQLSSPFIFPLPPTHNAPISPLLFTARRPQLLLQAKKKKKSLADGALDALEEIERAEALGGGGVIAIDNDGGEEDVPLSGKDLKRLAKLKAKGREAEPPPPTSAIDNDDDDEQLSGKELKRLAKLAKKGKLPTDDGGGGGSDEFAAADDQPNLSKKELKKQAAALAKKEAKKKNKKSKGGVDSDTCT